MPFLVDQHCEMNFQCSVVAVSKQKLVCTDSTGWPRSVKVQIVQATALSPHSGAIIACHPCLPTSKDGRRGWWSIYCSSQLAAPWQKKQIVWIWRATPLMWLQIWLSNATLVVKMLISIDPRGSQTWKDAQILGWPVGCGRTSYIEK